MSGGTIGPSDVTRMSRTVDFLRRSIENQTNVMKDQNRLLQELINLILSQTTLGEQRAQEGTPSTGSSQEGGVPEGGAPDRAGGLGEGSEAEGGGQEA